MTPPAAQVDWQHLPMLLIVGFALFAGGLGGRLFQKLRIPQVVGYILIGVLIGRSGLKLISTDAIEGLRLFNFFALGVIGFMIGGELRLDVFRRYGRQLLVILLAEGLTAFAVVGCLIFALTWAVTGEPAVAAALGLVLGAIASATAPAATVDVLWEYKTRGPLTTAVFALVALDDGLALLLFGVATSIAGGLLAEGQTSLLASIGQVAWELLGAVAMGVAVGAGLNGVLRLARDRDRSLTFLVGGLALVLGLAMAARVDLILAAMALGMTVANLAPRRSRAGFEIVERFAPPIYVLFFVVVGARLALGELAGWMWGLAAAFVVGRSAGKILGAYLGGRWARAASAVRRYLGLCLFSQAGVAIGLAILASERFADIGPIVITVVTATTFLVQILGPPCVKLAVSRAGEVGLNVTRDDLVQAYTVGQVMDPQPAVLTRDATFARIMHTLAETDTPAYPVVDDRARLLGVITLAELKAGLGKPGLGELVVADDLMHPPEDVIEDAAPLAEALTRMDEKELEYLPVVAPAQTGPPELLGALDRRKVERFLNHEVLRRQEQAVDREQADLLREAIRRRTG